MKLLWIAAVTAIALLTTPARAETSVVKIALLKFGTVNWLVDTIQSNGLDEAEGYQLEARSLAGKAATSVAFQSGDVDLFVTDWMWVLLQRDKGADYRFFPYSRALGALMSRKDQPIEDVCALLGSKLGVVGGALDKSWLAVRAYVQQACDEDLADKAELLFGAPPLLSRQLENGSVDAVLTFWPFAARLKAAGAHQILDVEQALATLGVDPAPALVGFVFDGQKADLDAIAAFQRSAIAAAEMLRHDDAEWERLRPLMRAKDDAEFITLRDRFRAGIASSWSLQDLEAAKLLHAAMIKAGGPKFAATTGPFDPSAFAAYGR